MQYSSRYVIGFAAAVCVVCSIFVSTSAVTLQERQDANKLLYRRKQVLTVAGLLEQGADVSREEIQAMFKANIEPRIVTISTGEYDESIDPANFDQRKATRDPAMSRLAPENRAGIPRVPDHALIYHVVRDGKIKMLILPIEGKGLWSTLYGFLALAPDTTTINGITFYEHGETPGLGGEVDNSSWKAKWRGRKAYDQNWEPAIRVVKGEAPPPSDEPYEVDGLSGATLTCRGVTNLLRFWLGENGFGPYLERFRSQRSAA